MKINFEFTDSAERDLFLESIAVASRFVSSNLDDIETNIKSALLTQLTQQFQRGCQLLERLGKKGVVEAMTEVDLKSMYKENSDLVKNTELRRASRSRQVQK